MAKIGSSAFCGCISLTEISIPDSVTEIGDMAFANCTRLSSVELSKGVTSIGYGAFYNCDSLTEIEIPKSLKSTRSDYRGGPFSNCDGLKEVSFEKGITEISSNLFYGCTGIEEIVLPDTVTIIEYNAFKDCSNLYKVGISDSVTEIEYNVFRDCTSLTQINIPDSVTDMGTYIFAGCSSLKEATVPNIRKNIPESTFQDCVNLEKVNFPATLECIRSYAFYNTKLSEAVLPEKLTEIESYAFYNCDNLTKVELQNNLTEIGNYAFYDCDALESITIPDSVTTLGTYIFAESELLSDVTFGTGITTIPSYAFNLCPSLKKIILPYRVTTINSNAFTNCTALTEITIPRATTTIAGSVFSYPSRLTIYGISGTYAQTYADTIGANFVNKETKATSVSLNKTELKMIKGIKSKLVLSVSPADFTDEVSWKSTDIDVVTVDDAGTVTAKAVGSATVKVTVGDVSESCKITVTQPVTSISLNKTSISLEAFETETLTASVYPSNAENKEIVWSTSDDKIASVDENGLVTAKTKGNATITAAAQDGSGVSGSCNMTVVNNGYLCNSVSQLESEHNYPADCSDFWLYTKAGAETLHIAFDARTNVEEDFDYIYLYDGSGREIGKYTGTQLAGQSVEVSGDTIKIKLVSDDAGTAWGFKVTSVIGTGNVENDECLVTFDSQGGSVIPSAQVPNGAVVEEPQAPVKKNYVFLGWYLDGELYDFTKPVTGNIILKARWRFEPEEETPGEADGVLTEDIPADGIIPAGIWIAGVSDQTYTGKALKPEVRVYDGNRRLKAGTDYTISYKRNTKANDASDAGKAPIVTVKGKGNYAGSASAAFKIHPVDLNDDTVSAIEVTLAYNGKLQKKAPTVTFNGKKLSVNKDFTVSYPSGMSGAYQQIGEYVIELKGIGNFTGTRTVKLEITDKALIEKAKVVKIKDQAYRNGEEIILSKSDLIVYTKSKNTPLTEGVDYTLRYEDNKEIGTASVFVTGIGDYAGTKKVTFKIVGTSLNKAVVSGIENKVYNGEEQRQNVKLTLNGIELKEDRDYTVIYEKNKNAGTAKMTIKGCNGYSGTIKKTFKIAAYDLEKDEGHLFTGLETGLMSPYTKGGCKPVPELKFKGEELTSGIDYKISYANNKKLSDASANRAPLITIKGKGNFKGTVSVPFTIVKKNLADAENPVSIMTADVGYVKGAGKYISKPVLTDTDGKVLKAGTDYEVSYMLSDGITKLDKKSSVSAGNDICVTVQGKGNYEGTLTTTYRITENQFTKAKITVTPQTYTGKRIYLSKEDIRVTIKNANGTTELTYGTDYEIIEDSYVNNLKKGTASVKVRGLGKYGGTKAVKFKIQAKRMDSFNSIVRKISEVMKNVVERTCKYGE